MQRIVGPGDFRRAGQLISRNEQQDMWSVCDGYEIREGEIVSRYPHPRIYVPDGSVDNFFENRHHWKVYRPLEEVPDLFLRLASLYDEKDFQEAALAFSSRYGVLGGSSVQWGGRADRTSLFRFREEARRAWVILGLYEAVLNCDGEAAGDLLLEHVEEALDGFAEPMPTFLQVFPNDQDLERCVEAIEQVIPAVERSVQALCRPTIIREKGYRHLELSGLRRGWNFSNLLGAAYLQIYWFMTSGGEISRCEHCHRIMSLSQTYPSGRKRRTDKKFCNAACRQAHHRSKNQH